MKTRMALLRPDYLALFLLLLSLRLIDLYVTYRITPDLAHEWNPLVSKLAFSWASFLVVQFLLVLVALVGYQRYSSRIRCPVSQPGPGLVSFVYYYFNGTRPTPRHWTRAFFKMPDKRYLKVSGAFIGFVIFMSFILASVFAITHNLLILLKVGHYMDFVVQHSSTYMVSVYVSLVVISANTFFLIEFFKYKRLSKVAAVSTKA